MRNGQKACEKQGAGRKRTNDCIAESRKLHTANRHSLASDNLRAQADQDTSEQRNNQPVSFSSRPQCLDSLRLCLIEGSRRGSVVLRLRSGQVETRATINIAHERHPLTYCASKSRDLSRAD